MRDEVINELTWCPDLRGLGIGDREREGVLNGYYKLYKIQSH